MARRLIASSTIQLTMVSLLNAQVVLDQENIVYQPSGESRSLSIGSVYSVAQVVTSGVRGHLSRVELGISRSSPVNAELFVDIATVIDGVPDFSEQGRIASVSFDADEVALPTTFPMFGLKVELSDFDLHFDVDDQFAILARSNADPFSYNWFVNSNLADTYTGGTTFSNFRDWEVDTHFRTFVAVVPEPHAFGILAGCLLGCGVQRRVNKLNSACADKRG